MLTESMLVGIGSGAAMPAASVLVGAGSVAGVTMGSRKPPDGSRLQRRNLGRASSVATEVGRDECNVFVQGSGNLS